MSKTNHTCTEKENISHLQIHNATMAQEITQIKSKVENIETKIDRLPEVMKEVFVSKIEFEKHKTNLLMMQKILYGGVGIALSLLLTSILYLTIKFVN